MAQAPSPATKDSDLPTIIIDPSAYVPERPSQSPRRYDNILRLSRVTLTLAAVGGATFGIAQLRGPDSFLQTEPVSALTSVSSDRVSDEVKTASPAAFEAPVAAAVEQPEAVEVGTEQAAEHAAAAQPVEPALAAPPAAPEPALPARAVARVVPVKAANATPDSALAALPKPVKKETNVEDEVRNARRLLALNRLEQAEAAYRRVLLVNASEPAAVTGLARVQLARGELDDALASAKRAVATAPGLASAQLTLGDVLRARGDKVAAQAHYDQAAQLMPTPDANEP